MSEFKIFHIDRDYSKTLEQQKKDLKQAYADFKYMFADGATGNAKIHFMSTGLKSKEENDAR